MRFHPELQCFVQELSYDYERRAGRVEIGNGGCTDMSGCVALFKKIDPEVTMIETISDGLPDTNYYFEDGKWAASAPPKGRHGQS